MSAVLVKFPRETTVSFNTSWSEEDEIIINLGSTLIEESTLLEGFLNISVDLSGYVEGIYVLDVFNNTTGESLSSTILVVSPTGMYPILKPLAEYLERTFITEDRSIITYTSSEFLKFAYQAYLSWGYDRTKTALSDRFIIVEAGIAILSSILDSVLNRDVLETPELKVDDSKLTSRILQRLKNLQAEKDSLVNTLFPDIAAELNEQPSINVKVSSTYRNRLGTTVPNNLNQFPEAVNLSVLPISGGFELSWDISYTGDFICYKIYSVKDEYRTLEKTFYNNLQNRYVIEKTDLDSIILETHDSGGLYCAETYVVEE